VNNDDIDGAFTPGNNFLAIRTGKTVKFYYVDPQGNWANRSNLTFTSPAAVDQVFYLNTGSMGVLSGNTIKFYQVNKQGAWEYKPGFDFTF